MKIILKNIDNYFTSFSSLEQIQYELTKLMQDKKVSIDNNGNFSLKSDNIREGNDEVIDELVSTLQKLMK